MSKTQETSNIGASFRPFGAGAETSIVGVEDIIDILDAVVVVGGGGGCVVFLAVAVLASMCNEESQISLYIVFGILDSR